MNLSLAVENMGLNKKEAQIYLALLELGEATAYNVSVKSGIKKPTTYVILDQLVEKGFAFKSSQEKKQIFTAESPIKCLAKIKEQLEFTRNAMPELLAVRRKGESKVSVSYYEGIQGIKNLYLKILKKAEKKSRKFNIFSFLGPTKEMPGELVGYWMDFNKEKARKGIKTQGILAQHPANEKFFKNQENLSAEFRGIPLDRFSSNILIEVYDQFVQIISFQKLQGILIDDPEIAKALKQIFEINWDLLNIKNIALTKKLDKKKEREIKPDEEIDIKINQIAGL